MVRRLMIPLLLTLSWTLAAMAAVWAVLVYTIEDRERPGPDLGDSILALPAGPSLSRDPLAGWPLLEQPRPAMAQIPDTGPQGPLPDIRAEETGPAHRLRLHGILASPSGPLYCFFDTDNRLWIRLRPGLEDPQTGLRLDFVKNGGNWQVKGPDGDRIVILDRKSGRSGKIGDELEDEK